MRLMERLYRSPLGRLMSWAANGLARLHKPFMVYGYYDPGTRRFRKYTRMSSNVVIMNRRQLAIGDHVWIGHYNILDATEGLQIGEGCQLAARVSIFTHGSQDAIRLLGRQFVHIPNTQRNGYTRGRVQIGAYTFIGAGSVVLPGVTIGKGCLIGTGTLVAKDVPDYAIVVGTPGKVRGSTLELDADKIKQGDFTATYYDQQAFKMVQQMAAITGEKEEGAHG